MWNWLSCSRWCGPVKRPLNVHYIPAPTFAEDEGDEQHRPLSSRSLELHRKESVPERHQAYGPWSKPFSDSRNENGSGDASATSAPARKRAERRMPLDALPLDALPPTLPVIIVPPSNAQVQHPRNRVIDASRRDLLPVAQADFDWLPCLLAASTGGILGVLAVIGITFVYTICATRDCITDLAWLSPLGMVKPESDVSHAPHLARGPNNESEVKASATAPLNNSFPSGRPFYNVSNQLSKRNASELHRPLQRANSSEISRTNSSETSRCHDAVEGEMCYRNVDWVMHTGIRTRPSAFVGLTSNSSFVSVQGFLHRQGTWACFRPCDDRRSTLTFYMYRAQDHTTGTHPVQNINMADLAGVLWYLHNEVVAIPGRERKHNITRIMRFQVSVKATLALYREDLRHFGQYVAFDRAKCTFPDCDKIWAKVGFVVGCKFLETQVAAYMASRRTSNAGVWYSLPGSCPDTFFDEKSPECKRNIPGGLCPGKVTGERDCTYNVTEAGWIGLDDLTGIPDRGSFTDAGHTEYNRTTDRGDGSDFWNGQHNRTLCSARLEKLRRLFDQKYPELPGCDEMRSPPCDI